VEGVQRRGDVLAARIATRDPLGLPLGGSIAVAGCCLTATVTEPLAFECELTEETLRRTSFESRLRPGVRINLERPLRADGRLDGHIVQGHVDGVGRVRALRRLGASAELEVGLPPELERYVVLKGSIAVDGCP
jgi:riboflavin synthase